MRDSSPLLETLKQQLARVNAQQASTLEQLKKCAPNAVGYRYMSKSEEQNSRIASLLGNMEAELQVLHQEAKPISTGRAIGSRQEVSNPSQLIRQRCTLEKFQIRKLKLQREKDSLQVHQQQLEQECRKLEQDITGLQFLRKFQATDAYQSQEAAVFREYLASNFNAAGCFKAEEVWKSACDYTGDAAVASIKLFHHLTCKVQESQRELEFLRQKLTTDLIQVEEGFTQAGEEDPQAVDAHLKALRSELQAKREREEELAKMTVNIFEKTLDYCEVDEEVGRRVSRHLRREEEKITSILAGIRKMQKMLEAVGSPQERQEAQDVLTANGITLQP